MSLRKSGDVTAHTSKLKQVGIEKNGSNVLTDLEVIERLKLYMMEVLATCSTPSDRLHTETN